MRYPATLFWLLCLGIVCAVGWSTLPAAMPQQAPAPATAAPTSSFGWQVGDLVPPLQFTDADGKAGSTQAWIDGKPTVLIARDLDCPISKRFTPVLKRLEQEWGDRGVRFAYVYFNPSQSSKQILAADRAAQQLNGHLIPDPNGEQLGRALRFRTTTEALLIDGAGTLVYRGAIDDRHGLTYAKEQPTRPYLTEALVATLAQRPIRTPRSDAPGCLLGYDQEPAPVAEREVTYHNRVSRILERNCTSCHRDGGVGPIDLTDYENARFYRFMIQDVLKRGLMPPWFAHEEYGTWSNERRLREDERADLHSWAAAGAPEGQALAPVRASRHVPGWNIGKPDVILEIEQPIAVPADGFVDYQYTYVKTDFPEDRWIEAMEIRPTAPEVTHHVLVFLESPEVEEKRRSGDRSARPQGGLRGYFASTVPGFEANVFPAGAAKKLPQGAWLKFQIHYTPNGTPTTDRTRIGFKFAKQAPKHEVRTAAAVNTRFEIPAGAGDHPVSARVEFGRNARLLNFLPHMHLRGKAFRYTLETPDGEERILLDIPRYDFNWQLDYRAAEPIDVPKGAAISVTGWFDNSPGNPANPDPTAVVGFGEQTYDEMMIGYFDYISLE